MCWDKWIHTHTERHKMNFKINLNGFYTYTRAKIIKLLEEFLHDLRLGKTLKIWHQKVQSIKEFIKLNLIKIKNFYNTIKILFFNTIKKMKRWAIGWEKTFANHLSDKRFVSGICKEFFNSIRHMTQLTKGKFSVDILLQIYKWLTRTWKDAQKPLAIREIQMVSFFLFCCFTNGQFLTRLNVSLPYAWSSNSAPNSLPEEWKRMRTKTCTS